MKKLVEVILAPNDFSVLFDLNSERISNNGAFKIIENNSYYELMKGDGAEKRGGVIVYMSKEEYTELKEQKKID